MKVIKLISFALLILFACFSVYAESEIKARYTGQNTEHSDHGEDPAGTSIMERLTSTISTSPADLRTEAAGFDIPRSRVKRYVVEMRNINRRYQDGSLTRTQYIGIKQRVIERLR